MSKKLRSFGYVLFISGTVLFGIMHLAIALYIPDLQGWSDPPGKFKTVLNEISGWVPYILSIVFMVIGAFFSVYGLTYKWWHKQMIQIKEKNREFEKPMEGVKDREE